MSNVSHSWITADIISCSISGLISLAAFAGHVLLGLFYWLKTGTFPLKEEIKTNLDHLKKDHPEDNQGDFVPLNDGF